MDVSFHRTIAPALLDGRVHRTLILFQGADEALHFVDAGGAVIHARSVLILPVRKIVRKLITRLGSPRIQDMLSSRHPRCSVARWSSLTAAWRVTPPPPGAGSADIVIRRRSHPLAVPHWRSASWFPKPRNAQADEALGRRHRSMSDRTSIQSSSNRSNKHRNRSFGWRASPR